MILIKCKNGGCLLYVDYLFAIRSPGKEHLTISIMIPFVVHEIIDYGSPQTRMYRFNWWLQLRTYRLNWIF